METITGTRPFLSAMLRGPRSGDRLPLAVGGGVLGVLVGADLLVSGSAAMASTYMLAPFISAMLGAVWATLILAVAAAGAAAASGDWNMNFGAADYWVRMAGLLIAGGFALVGAWARERSRLNSRRLHVLNEIGAVADGSLPLRETLRRVIDQIVPIAADICMVDVISDGRVMRAAVRAAGAPGATEVEDRVRRREPSVPRWMVQDVPQWRRLPRFVPRLRDEDLRRMAQGPDDLEFLERLAPRSSIVTPIMARGRSLGALTMVTAWSRRRYSTDDVKFAQILSGRVGLALDNAGIFSDLESVERRMDAVVSMVSEAVVVHDATGRLVFANLAAARALGYESPQALVDAPAGQAESRFEVLTEDGEPFGERDPVRARLERGELPWQALVRIRLAASGDERWGRVAADVIRGPDGEALYTITTVDDVTEVKRAELAQRLLATTGELLSSSLDFEQTLSAVARLAVPRFADWCSIQAPGEDGALEQLAASHVAPEKVILAQELNERYPSRMEEAGRVQDVIRSGESVLIGTIDEEMLRGMARDDRHFRLLTDLGIASAIIAPMTAGAEVIGALSFVNGHSSRRFDEADLAIATEIARRAGMAFANARLASEQAEVATTLQRGLLPPTLPEMPGWAAAAMYRPAGVVNEVGGDFYDAFEFEGGWMILVGDVAGRGAQAASVTALARHTIRTAGMLTGDPRQALAMLDRALREQPEAGLCTAVILTIPRGDAHRTGATIVCAGHPPPLMLRDDEVKELPAGGPMLGAIEEADWAIQRVEMRHRDQIVLYTDGVTEAKGASDRFGQGRLRAGIAGSSDPKSAIARIEGRLDSFLATEPQDDAAAVVVQRVLERPGEVSIPPELARTGS